MAACLCRLDVCEVVRWKLLINGSALGEPPYLLQCSRFIVMTSRLEEGLVKRTSIVYDRTFVCCSEITTVLRLVGRHFVGVEPLCDL
jgi:hypothetical protein